MAPQVGVWDSHTLDVEDNTLLCFEAFKDFSVPYDVEDFEPTKEMMSFWATPSIARTQGVDISELEELYGREGDTDSEVEEDFIHPTAVFKAMEQPKKDPPIPSGGFQYVDAALAASMKVGLHVCAMDCNPRVQLIHMCMPV